jgi:hypothetical protein
MPNDSALSRHSTAAPRASGDNPRFALPLAFAVAAAVVILARSDRYKAGDDFGYWLGVAGGSLMLLLFLYPLRKRMHRFTALGPQRHWFRLHMVLGITGPLLIFLHSKFQLGSLNASVAFWSMVLVASSGIAGRFIYARLHHGLYGHQITLEELRAKAGVHTEMVRSWLVLVPAVEQRLGEFSGLADAAAARGLANPLRMLTLGLSARRAARDARKALQAGLECAALVHGWDYETEQRRLRKGAKLIDSRIENTLKVAQFSAWKRLFSMWHILHVPLIWMLVLSAIAHVVAVHMY